jgi:hypothetical protein
MQNTEQQHVNGGAVATDDTNAFDQRADEYPHDQGDSTPAPKRDTMLPGVLESTDDLAAQLAGQREKTEAAERVAAEERARLVTMAEERLKVLDAERFSIMLELGPRSDSAKALATGVTEDGMRLTPGVGESPFVKPLSASEKASLVRRANASLRPAKAAKKATRSPKGGRAGTAGIVEALLANVVALLSKSKTGMRSEEIQKALKLGKVDAAKVLRAGIEAKSLGKKGQKRSTTYHAK